MEAVSVGVSDKVVSDSILQRIDPMKMYPEQFKTMVTPDTVQFTPSYALKAS